MKAETLIKKLKACKGMLTVNGTTFIMKKCGKNTILFTTFSHEYDEALHFAGVLRNDKLYPSDMLFINHLNIQDGYEDIRTLPSNILIDAKAADDAMNLFYKSYRNIDEYIKFGKESDDDLCRRHLKIDPSGESLKQVLVRKWTSYAIMYLAQGKTKNTLLADASMYTSNITEHLFRYPCIYGLSAQQLYSLNYTSPDNEIDDEIRNKIIKLASRHVLRLGAIYRMMHDLEKDPDTQNRVRLDKAIAELRNLNPNAKTVRIQYRFGTQHRTKSMAIKKFRNLIYDVTKGIFYDQKNGAGYDVPFYNITAVSMGKNSISFDDGLNPDATVGIVNWDYFKQSEHEKKGKKPWRN